MPGGEELQKEVLTCAIDGMRQRHLKKKDILETSLEFEFELDLIHILEELELFGDIFVKLTIFLVMDLMN